MQARLGRDAIVRATLELIEEDGVDAVTMRAVGARLGCEAMSLYRHVANKADLLRLVGEAVIAEIRVPRAAAGWDGALRALLRDLRRVALKYPAAFGLVSQGAVTAVSAPALQAGMEALTGGGLSEDEAAQALCLCLTYATGAISNELAANRLGGPLARSDDPHADFSDAPLAAHFLEVMARTNYKREFEAGIDVLLRGLKPARA
jgi:AcrR family transcriptional regulator